MNCTFSLRNFLVLLAELFNELQNSMAAAELQIKDSREKTLCLFYAHRYGEQVKKGRKKKSSSKSSRANLAFN